MKVIKCEKPTPEGFVINFVNNIFIKVGEEYYQVVGDENVKRKVLSDGTFPMTREEKEEFHREFLVPYSHGIPIEIFVDKLGVFICICEGSKDKIYLNIVEKEWLLKRFEV